jgi:hypothetical protein
MPYHHLPRGTVKRPPPNWVKATTVLLTGATAIAAGA